MERADNLDRREIVDIKSQKGLPLETKNTQNPENRTRFD